MAKRSWLKWLAPKPALLSLWAFRERVAGAIQSTHPDAKIQREGEETLLVTLNDGETEAAVLNCGRVHGLYCQEPGDLNDLVQRLAGSIAAPYETATPDALRILIRPAAYLFEAEHPDDTQIRRPIAGDLFAVVALDGPRAVSFPVASQLREDLGLADAAIWELALENTRRNLPELELPPAGEIAVIICAEGEASGLLSLDDAWRRIDEEADEGVLVLPGEKNALCVIGGFDAAAMPALLEVLRIAEASPDHLSAVPLTRREGRWIEAFELDPAFDARGPKH